jgi:hypothetical protein
MVWFLGFSGFREMDCPQEARFNNLLILEQETGA